MKYNTLGGTGLLVSEFALGTMTFGGKDFPMSAVMGALDDNAARRLVDEALAAGINLFDSANQYGLGESEEILGRALKGRRGEVVISTKVRFRMGPGINQAGLSRAHLIEEAEACLKRLGTDYIDLFQIHGPDPLTDWEETMRALDDLVRSGKVRYIGCSNLQGWQMMKANGICGSLACADSNRTSLIIHWPAATLSGISFRSFRTSAWGCSSGARWQAVSSPENIHGRTAGEQMTAGRNSIFRQWIVNRVTRLSMHFRISPRNANRRLHGSRWPGCSGSLPSPA